MEKVLEWPETHPPVSKSMNTLRGTNAQLQGLPWVLRSAAHPHREWAGSSALGVATGLSPSQPLSSMWSLPFSSLCLHHPTSTP